jgi:hypothetical protein
MTRRIVPTCLAVVAGAMLLAACTSSGTAGTGSAVQTPTATSSDTTASDTSSASDTATATATTSTPAPPTTTATHAGDECTFAQLSMRAIRGSGAGQQEFASIMFTNKSAAACSLTGYPGVSLRANSILLGQPASRDASTAATTVHLAPGAQAHADVTDDSSCQAPLSDTVRVYPPDSTQFVDLPLVLRGCTLSVKPVVAS